jgi:hypothetical protein
MEQQMAIVRSWGVALTAERIPLAAPSLSDEDPERNESLYGKMKEGRATKSTPVNAMRPAEASLTVNGSCKSQSVNLRYVFIDLYWELTRRATQAMNAVRVGTRKVITVASDTSRYERESARFVSVNSYGKYCYSYSRDRKDQQIQPCLSIPTVLELRVARKESRGLSHATCRKNR